MVEIGAGEGEAGLGAGAEREWGCDEIWSYLGNTQRIVTVTQGGSCSFT